MGKISFLIFFVGFLLFRPFQMAVTGMLYEGDDYSYFAHASSMVYGQFPSYKKEFYMTAGKSPFHSVGAGIAAVPFVYAFSWLDILQGGPIIERRTRDNIIDSWTLYGFVLSSVFYLWLGCFFLYRGLRHHFKEFESVLAVFLMVLCQGIPLFAFRRPVFSHITEFCVTSLLAWWLLIPREQRPRWCQGYYGASILGVALGLNVLIRLNNALMLVVWPLILFVMTEDLPSRARGWKKVLLSYAVAACCVVLFQILPDLINKNTGNNSVIQDLLLNFHPPVFYLQRLGHILTGIDWGLIYTAPFLLIGLMAGVVLKFPLRKAVWFSLLPLLVNLYVVISWKTQGSWYGYRYLVPAAVPLAAYPLAFLLKTASGRIGKVAVFILCLVLCLPPLFSMLAFEGNARELMIWPVDKDSGWTNLTYQSNVWKMLIDQPERFMVAVFKGGPVYLLFCLRTFFHNDNLLPLVNQRMYFSLSPVLFFKTMLIYAAPFILWLVFNKALIVAKKGDANSN